MSPVLAIPGFIIGFVLALVSILKKQPSRGLVLTYATFQGLFVGRTLGHLLEKCGEFVPQAVFGTLAVIGVTLFLFLSGKFRTSPCMTRIAMVDMVGYLVFSLANFGLMMFGTTDGMFGLRCMEIFRIPLSVFLGVLGVLLAAYALVMDVASIQACVQQGAPRAFGC